MAVPAQTRWRLWAAAVGLAAFGLRAEVVVSEGPVVPGEWNADFPAVLAVANREHRPMVLVYSSHGCPLCARLNQAMDGEAFTRWQRDRGYLMAYVRTSSLNVEAYRQVRDFVKSISGELPDFPYVCVYWPKEDGTTNSVAFAGRRGKMGGAKDDLFSVEVMTAVDRVAKGHWSQKPGHLPVETIVSNSTKTVAVGKVGPEGTVTMRPESGVLPEGGKVVLTAKASDGYLFVSWKDPAGSVVGWQNRLEIAGRMTGGVYTASFRAKEDCPPPTLSGASTSLCVRVGRAFEYAIPVDAACRPVQFHAPRRLPKGVRFDKVAGRLSGVPRKTGETDLPISVIGSDAAHTVKKFTVKLNVQPDGKPSGKKK